MPASSATSSSSVATPSTAFAEPATKVAEEGGAPSSTAPLSVTANVTVSAAAVLPVRVSVNEAAVPSVTGVDEAAIDTTGSGPDPKYPSCARSASTGLSTLRMVPPLSSRLLGFTTTEWCAPSPWTSS